MDALPAGYATDLRFRVDGVEHVIENPDPALLLVDWLRSPQVGLTGTKKSCAQGGCGACTVMLSRWDAQRAKVQHLAINSCLRPLCSLDGMQITTTEGTGSSRTGLSPVQYRIARENGSQCGFCTPGFVMNMHAFLAANAERRIEQLEIEELFDGNLCRCTGYRPILYAMRHFATDWSPKDEEGCLRTVVDQAEKVPHAKTVTVSFPEELQVPPRGVHYNGNGYDWYRPLTLGQVHAILSRHDVANCKLVGGNTSIGVYDRFVENPRVLIDISQLSELRAIAVADAALELGAAVTYGELMTVLTDLIASQLPERRQGLDSLHYMARRTAGHIVRNAATLAGNTLLVARHVATGVPFPSDLFTALCAAGAKVNVSHADGSVTAMPVLDFAQQYAASPDLQRGVLVSYEVPWTGSREYSRSYKTALREVNAHSIVNAGMRVKFSKAGMVQDAALVFAGIGPVAFHAGGAEKALQGRAWNAETLAGAIREVRADVEATLAANRQRMSGLIDEGFSDAYKTHLAESCFYQFFVYVLEQTDPAAVSPRIRSAGTRCTRPVSSGKQNYEKYCDEYPVNLPIVKLAAFLQASGEARYTQDLSPGDRGLEGAMVTSACVLAGLSYRVPAGDGYTAVDVTGLVAFLRGKFAAFVDYVTAADIPAGGKNGDPGDPVFAEDAVTYYGQAIGLVLARTEADAIDIAQFVSTECIAYRSAGTPLLTIEQARKAQSIFPDRQPYPVHIWKVQRPGSDLAWTNGSRATIDGIACHVTTGSMESGAQLHFYMESQACLAVPGEMARMVVYPSSQSPDAVHSGVHSILNIPANRVDVKIERVGGGYGGKTTRSPYVASATALAAWKHRRPVRLAMRRENDSAMVGHRHPLYSEYAIAIADVPDPGQRGRILGMSTDFHLDGGATYDCSFVVMDCIQLRCDSAYMVPNYQTSGEVCRTNKASNTAMRSMGLVQAMLAQEDAIEKAAYEIGMRPEEVRGKNLYRQGQLTPFGQPVDYCYLDEVWKRIGNLSDFNRRQAAVETFNRENRWRKRGISMIPVKYGSGYNAVFLEQAGALIEVYSQDGSVLIRHGGVEIGQGLVTKVAQIAALALNLPLELIETSATDTQVVPNPVSTGASTGTGFNGGAVKQACQELRARLEAYCMGLLGEHGPQWCKRQGINFWDYDNGWQATTGTGDGERRIWSNIVALANSDRVDLSAQVRFEQEGGEAVDSGLIFKPDVSETVNHFTGFTFSAACTEVEIDVLTGETTVLRADLVYDMGKSLNPAIDIGQVEGAYVQGLGYVLTEDVVFQPDGPSQGALNTDNTWRYKVPATTTIPLEFNVDLFPRSEAPEVAENPFDLYSSKEVGEPPLVLAVTAYFAVKHAVLAARRDKGIDGWFALPAPATVQRVREACLTDLEDLRI